MEIKYQFSEKGYLEAEGACSLKENFTHLEVYIPSDQIKENESHNSKQQTLSEVNSANCL